MADIQMTYTLSGNLKETNAEVADEVAGGRDRV